VPNPLLNDSPPTETLYLIGTSGHPNFGDEFVTAAWLRFLARARPHAEVWLDCPGPATAAHLFNGLHPRLRTTDTLWRTMWQTNDLELPAAEAEIDRMVTRLGSPRFDIGLLDAQKASSVHVLGGGYLNAVWPRHTLLLRAALRLRDVSGARLAATGIGLMPPADAAGVRAALGEFDHATVADEPSAELAGLEMLGDDALLGLPLVRGFRDGTYVGDDAGGDVWVCLQHDMASPDAFEAALTAVREALSGPDLSGRTVRYLEAMPGVDRIAFDRLSDLIGEENFVPFLRLWEEGLPARPGQVWLTTRLHLHLLAAASGARGAALEVNEDYYRVKHRSLLDAGTGWSVTPVGSTSLEPPTSSRGFRSVAARLHKAKAAEAERLYPAADPAPAEPVPAQTAREPRAQHWLRRR
jgi:hypothetical protein